MMKAILHIDEAERWTQVLNNAMNLVEHQSIEDIEILANGSAIELLIQGSPYADQFSDFVHKGGRLCVCQQSMKRYTLSQEQMLPFLEPVPFGVIEILEREKEGFGYIKP